MLCPYVFSAICCHWAIVTLLSHPYVMYASAIVARTHVVGGEGDENIRFTCRSACVRNSYSNLCLISTEHEDGNEWRLQNSCLAN